LAASHSGNQYDLRHTEFVSSELVAERLWECCNEMTAALAGCYPTLPVQRFILFHGCQKLMSKREFQTEVNQLLQLIVHSLYSHPEIFLRELISNSSDALDKLRHLTLVDEVYKAIPFDPRIDLELDEENKTLTIADTGIGMNEEDLISHLGTIARSGTKNFLSKLSGDALRDSNLIGQFGVGFYSAFMVADRIEVVSRKAGEEQAWRWISDGKTGFDIEPAERPVAGTTVLLHFNEEGKQYANSWRLQEIVKKYSNHIAFPIFLTYDKSDWNAEEKKSIKTRTTEQVNVASALWRRPKNEITDEGYKELYKSITGDSEDPLFWFHTKAEGSLEYTTLSTCPRRRLSISTMRSTRLASSSTSSASSLWTTAGSCCRSISASCAASSIAKIFPQR